MVDLEIKVTMKASLCSTPGGRSWQRPRPVAGQQGEMAHRKWPFLKEVSPPFSGGGGGGVAVTADFLWGPEERRSQV